MWKFIFLVRNIMEDFKKRRNFHYSGQKITQIKKEKKIRKRSGKYIYMYICECITYKRK